MNKKIYYSVLTAICLSCLPSVGMANPNHILKSVKTAAKAAKSARSAISNVAQNVAKTAGPQHPLVPKVPKDFPRPEILPYEFQARATGAEITNCYSGVFFQTEYNGKPFLGAVLAAHAFDETLAARDGSSPTLQRDFTIDTYINGEFVSIPAHAEEIASMSMGDIVLASIPEEYMDKVQYAPLDREPIEEGDSLTSFGFSSQIPRCVEDRVVTSQTPFCLRTTISLPRYERGGTCGTAVGRTKILSSENMEKDGIETPTDDAQPKTQFYISGIHTGSSPAKGKLQDMGNSSNNEANDIGHATKAFMIDLLVEAFFNDGNVTVPLELGNVKIFDMRLDEYISYIKLFDETGKQIWQRNFEYKFAYDQVNNMIRTLSPRYLEMTVRRIGWTENGHLHELRKRQDPTRYTVRYDFQKNELSVSVPKSHNRKNP